MRILLIINPISGTRSKRRLRRIIEKRISAMGHDLTVAETRGPGHATELARNAAGEGFDAVFACGGDGTVNEVARGLIGSGVPMAILPAGSGNGLARHIEMPPDPLLALKTIKRSHIVDCDYCTVNGTPFFCTFGLGFDAAVSHRFAKSRRRGLITYLKSAIDEFLKFDHQTYTLDANGASVSVDAFLIACCNASQYGNNAFIAPTASITDGLLDITIVHSGNPLSQVLVGVELLAGSIASGGLIDVMRTPAVTIERDSPGIAHIDGESVELPARLEIKCHHGGLLMFAPVKHYRFKPLLTPARLFFRDIAVGISALFRRS